MPNPGGGGETAAAQLPEQPHHQDPGLPKTGLEIETGFEIETGLGICFGRDLVGGLKSGSTADAGHRCRQGYSGVERMWHI